MEKQSTQSNSIADNIKSIEFCVKNLEKLAEKYTPLPKRMYGYNLMNDPINYDEHYWAPFDKENGINRLIAQYKTSISSLIEQKDGLTQTQLYAAQNRTLDMIKLAIATHRLEDATQFTHLLSSGELEGKTSPMKHRSEKVKSAILEIVSLYKTKYDSLNGGMFSHQSTEDSNKQYNIKKTVEALMDDVKAGKYGDELKGEEKGSLYKEMEDKFFGWAGRYFIHDHDMF